MKKNPVLTTILAFIIVFLLIGPIYIIFGLAKEYSPKRR